MKTSPVAIVATLVLVSAPLFASSAVAASNGCYSTAIKNGHAFASYCPASAPYAHQGFADLWFTSGYSKYGVGTAIAYQGQEWVESGYYYGGTVTRHWQKLY